MKLHIGCGTVYLRDYLNVDLRQSGAVLACEQPDLAAERSVPESDYYAGTRSRTVADFATSTAAELQERVCDAYGSFENMPCDDHVADEILSRQVFEHLSAWEAQRALKECRRVLKTDGLLRLSVPDVPATIELWRNAVLNGDTTTEIFCGRHIFGSRKSEAFYHLCAWDTIRLTAACANYGFELVNEEPNIHSYPAICLKFRKLAECIHDRPAKIIPMHKASWEYAGDPRGVPIMVPDEARCLEVGPGKNPWPRANMYVDMNPENLAGIRNSKTLVCDVQNLRVGLNLRSGNKFDVVFCSHVLEHVEDPLMAAQELSAVAHRGIVVCPSPFKEGMFNFGEADHKWWVLPPWKHDSLIFVRIDPEWRKHVYNRDVESQLHQLFRLGAERFGESGEQAREWFYNAEPHLDTIHRWQGELKIEVIQ